MAEMLKIDHICKTFNAGTINEKIALNGVDLTKYLLAVMMSQNYPNTNAPNI